MNWWKIGAAVAVLAALGGVVTGYLEYREVKDQVEPIRERWEQARDRAEALEANLAHMDSVWADSAQVLNRRRDSLEAALAEAGAERAEAHEEAVAAGDSLVATLQRIRETVRPELHPVVDTAQKQLSLLRERHDTERMAASRQITHLTELLDQARGRRDHWMTRSDSLEALAEARLQRALAAEQERDVWENKAKWDLLDDGPQALLHAGIGIGLYEGAQAVLGN